MVFREVLLEVVQLPVLRVLLGQRPGVHRRAKTLSRFRKRRTGPGTYGAPAIVVQGTMAEHLEVLCDVSGGRLRVIETVGEAVTFDWGLRHAVDRRRSLEAERLEHGRHHVDGVRVLRADFSFGPDAFRPVDQERIADTTPIGLPFPTTEGRVAGERPTPRVVVEILGT